MKSFAIICTIALICLAGLSGAAAKSPAPERGKTAAAPTAKAAATTAITYQGRLVASGAPATGVYDFRFFLYDALTSGNVVSSATLDNVAVTNGQFTVKLDFGYAWDGGRYFLAINVRPGASTGAYTALTPRQEVTAAPYALGLVYPLFTQIASDSPAIAIDNAGAGGGIDMRGTPSFATGYFASDAEGDALRGDANETATGSAVTGLHMGSQGDAGWFEVTNDANGGAGIFARTAGAGQAIDAEVNSPTAAGDAIFARTDSSSADSYAGYFVGKVRVEGALTVTGAKNFKIDHPLDPANKYLNHSCVESADMMNVYNGNVTLGADGKAEVALPEWFEALNKDFRYQLTAIGAPGPNLHIAQEVSANRFKIAGGLPGQRVSWQVTGVRRDAYANAHRMVVEEVKPESERGTYVHPELYGKPDAKATNKVRRPVRPAAK